MKVCFVSTNSSENLPFISHMVQMKGIRICAPVFKLVLSLYPTWFRWKIGAVAATSVNANFISHMVQMKGQFSWDMAYITSPSLYPTWFRWKLVIMPYYSIHHNFISHMVQMKGNPASGSCSGQMLDFISHMVQMKVHLHVRNHFPDPPLYPTWFRWKDCSKRYLPPRDIPLYPTWFRWKVYKV